MYRIVLLGSGDLANAVLKGLLAADCEISGVLPWEILARKQSLGSRLKRFLVEDTLSCIKRHGLPLLPQVKANSREFKHHMDDLQPDILMVAGWGEILNAAAISSGKVANLNIHPSLLPKHRGFNPVSSALCAGETETGVTYHHLTESIDAGDILLQSKVYISDDDNGESLRRKLVYRAKEMVLPALEQVRLERRIPQSEQPDCYKHKLNPADRKINWGQPAVALHNLIRGCFPWHPAETLHQGSQFAIHDAAIVDNFSPIVDPGRVLDKVGTKLVVATGDPNRALILNDVRFLGSLGAPRYKLYASRYIRVGDIFS